MNYGFTAETKILPIKPTRQIRNLANRYIQLARKHHKSQFPYNNGIDLFKEVCWKGFTIRCTSSNRGYIGNGKVSWGTVLFFRF